MIGRLRRQAGVGLALFGLVGIAMIVASPTGSASVPPDSVNFRIVDGANHSRCLGVSTGVLLPVGDVALSSCNGNLD